MFLVTITLFGWIMAPHGIHGTGLAITIAGIISRACRRARPSSYARGSLQQDADQVQVYHYFVQILLLSFCLVRWFSWYLLWERPVDRHWPAPWSSSICQFIEHRSHQQLSWLPLCWCSCECCLPHTDASIHDLIWRGTRGSSLHRKGRASGQMRWHCPWRCGWDL